MVKDREVEIKENKSKIKGKITVAVICALIVSLVLGLAVCAVNLNKQSKKIENISSSLSSAQKENSEINGNLSEAKSQLESIRSELGETKKQLEEKTESEKELQEKTKILEEENRQLKLKKQLEQAAASKAVSSAAVNSENTVLPANTGDKVCYLTFDDGPSDNTLEILKILKKYGAKATFFVTSASGTHPEYIKNISKEGHTVGLHTATHNYSIYSSPERYFEDLNKISDIVKNYTGKESKIIRFPGGSSNRVSKDYCAGIMSKLVSMVTEKGYTYVDWNVDSGDAKGNNISAGSLVNSVLNGANNKNAICVLMHDTKAKKTTVQALAPMIEGLAKKGFRFEGLSSSSPVFHHRVQN